MANINVNQYQRPGIYINEIDNSLTQLPVQSQLINLVVGFSKKGKVNSPVLITSKQQFISIFGDIDRNLEKKGSYFHRTVLNIISKGPVWALNILDTDDTLDLIDVKDISVTTGNTNSNIKQLPYSSVYDKSQFWNLDTETFLSANSGTSQLLHITNISNKPVSVFMFKSSAKGYDDTLDIYYGSASNVPPYLSPKDQAKDYLVTMLVIQGDWSNYANLSVDTKYSKYFNKNGLIKSAVNSFVNDTTVTVLANYSDLSLIPYFNDLNGVNKFIETVVNQDTQNTGIFVTYNTSLLDDSDYNTGLLDLIGNNIVDSEIESIDYLSYKESLTEILTYEKSNINVPGNAFGYVASGDAIKSELFKNFTLDAYKNNATPGSFSITNSINFTDISLVVDEPNAYVILNGKRVDVNTNSSLSWKTNVKVATTADIVRNGLTTVIDGVPSPRVIDGVPLANGDRVLVKNQINATENGIYVASAGDWSRSTDTSTGDNLVAATVLVIAGTANSNTKWTCITSSIVLGTTNVVFNQLLITPNNITVAWANTGRVRKDTIYIDSNGSYGVATGVEVSDKTLFPNIPIKAIPSSVYPIAVVTVSDAGIDATKTNSNITISYEVKVATSGVDNRALIFPLNPDSVPTPNMPILPTIDGVTLTVGERVLLTAQTNKTQNGVYIVTATGLTRTSDSLLGVYVKVTHGAVLNTIWKNTNTSTIDLNTSDIEYVRFTGFDIIKPIENITFGDNTKDISVSYIGINQLQLVFKGTDTKSGDVLYKKTLLKRIFANFQSKFDLGKSVIKDTTTMKRVIKNIVYNTASDSNLSIILNIDPIYNISGNGNNVEIYFEDIEQVFGPEGSSTNANNFKISPDSKFYKAFYNGTINSGDYFYPQYKGGDKKSIKFINTSGTSTISVPESVTLSNLSVGTQIAIYGSSKNDGIYTVLTSGINSISNNTDIIVNETVSEETVVCDIHNASDKVYLKMYDSNNEFFLSYSLDSGLVDNTNLSDYVGDNNTGLNVIRVISLKSDFKETVEIEQVIDSNTIVVDAKRYSALTIGNYLKADYDISTLQIGEVPRKLTRIVDKRSYPSDVTKTVLKTDAPIDILTFGTDQQTFAYTAIENYVNTYKAIKLKGFVVRAESMPNGTEERQSDILDMIAPNTPLSDGLINRNKISWRYLVDSFGLGLTANSKQQLADLCANRSNAFGIINAPSAKSFKNSQTPSFIDQKSKALRTDYVRSGGNLEANPAFLYSFAQGVAQSYIGYFFPYGSILDNGRPMDVPPSSYILNTFMNKHLSTSSVVNPWTPAAGIDNGLVTGLGNLEMDFTNDDITNLNLMGMNPIVYKMNRGLCIETNNTAQTTPKTSLSYITSREALIELEDALYEMLLGYQWKTNTPTIRAEIKKKADAICERYKANNAIFDYENVMDETNNLPQYIDAQIGILDSYVELAKNMAIIVNNVTILPTGAIQAGGYKSPNS